MPSNAVTVIALLYALVKTGKGNVDVLPSDTYITDGNAPEVVGGMSGMTDIEST